MQFLASNPFIAIIILLGVLVIVHELGHFIVGKLSGIAVITFSIGFGPSLTKFFWRGTKYQLAWIPLGGYVQFAGMMPGEEVPDGINGKKFRDVAAWKRALTIAAGPVANIILAIVIYTGLIMSGIERAPAEVGMVQPGSPAELAGIEPGDRIVSVDGKTVNYWSEMLQYISAKPGETIRLQVKRQKQTLDLSLKTRTDESKDYQGKTNKVGRIGIILGAPKPYVAFTENAAQTLSQADLQVGDEIIAVGASESTFTEVKFWPDFKDAVQSILSSEDYPGQIYLKVKTIKTEHKIESIVSIEMASDAAFESIGFLRPDLLIRSLTAPASKVLKPGDQVVAWNDRQVATFFDYMELLKHQTTRRVKVGIIRQAQRQDVWVDLYEYDIQLPEGKKTLYKLNAEFYGELQAPKPLIEKRQNFVDALQHGIDQTAFQSTFLLRSLGGFFTGETNLKSIGGVLMIAKVASDAAEAGLTIFLSMMGLISVNLAVVNLIPIPALDGGQLVILGIETVRRKRMSIEAIENFQKIGFAMIFALMILAFYNDLTRLWSGIIRSVIGQG